MFHLCGWCVNECQSWKAGVICYNSHNIKIFALKLKLLEFSEFASDVTNFLTILKKTEKLHREFSAHILNVKL